MYGLCPPFPHVVYLLVRCVLRFLPVGHIVNEKHCPDVERCDVTYYDFVVCHLSYESNYIIRGVAD